MVERSYAQFCGVARALDILGGRWTLLIVRNLLLGPRRYSTLLAELPGITTNLLAARLQHLEKHGITARVDDDGHTAWALTSAGALLEPVVMELGRFGARSMKSPRRGERVDMGWALLSMKRRYRGGVSMSAELRLRDTDDAPPRVFGLTFTPTYLRVRDRSIDVPGLVISTTAEIFRAAFLRGGDVDALVNDGDVVFAGSDKVWRSFVAAFAPLPLAGTGGADPDVALR